MNTITRRLALPLLSAGAVAGAALGLAGTASAEVTTNTTNGSHAIMVRPDTTARPATMIAPYSHRRHHHNNPWR